MPTFMYRELAWAYLIVLGGVLVILIPGGVIPIPDPPCLACVGPLVTIGLGVISVVFGTIGFVLRSSNPIAGRQ
jgi:hypothetical protein